MILNRVTVTQNNEPLTLADLRELVDQADSAWIPDDAIVRNGEDAALYEIYVETNREFR